MTNQPKFTIALIGVGEMGAAIGRRLKQHGARVRTSLEGRSGDSVARARNAGLEIVEDEAALVHDADFVLSIVPPGVAVAVAEQLREFLTREPGRAIFVECNAISPTTTRRIGEIIAPRRYVDAGIIGVPPPEQPDGPTPRIYASGADAREFAKLNPFGLDVALLDGPIGAASALKLSYAGLTKGITALGTAMVGAAARAGLADALRAELARSQPQVLARLERGIPAMYPKAYRWVAEMEQIAEFLGSDDRGASIYAGAARLYESVAAEVEHGGTGLGALTEFCKSGTDRKARSQ